MSLLYPSSDANATLIKVRCECWAQLWRGTSLKKCSIQRAASSCIHFISQDNLKADERLVIEMGSNESNVFDFIWNWSRLVHLAMLRATSSSWPDDLSSRDMSNNLKLPWVDRWHGGFLSNLCRKCVCFSSASQPMNPCPSWSLEPYGDGRVA